MKVCKKGLHQYPDEHKFCKECRSLTNKKWAEQNKERKQLTYKKYYSENKSRINKRSREYFSSNKEDIKIQQKAYNQINKPHLKKKSKEWFLKNRYNMTPEGLIKLYELHNHSCAICLKTELNGKKLHIDHDHKTGEVRGLLCGSCNRAIGLLKDSIDNLLNAYNYLVKFKKD